MSCYYLRIKEQVFILAYSKLNVFLAVIYQPACDSLLSNLDVLELAFIGLPSLT